MRRPEFAQHQGLAMTFQRMMQLQQQKLTQLGRMPVRQ
jgi:hypothetical protein